jgi:hypothetical protein
MYCSACGVAVAGGLSYCNHCGAKVSRAKNKDDGNPAEIKPESLIASIVALFIFGHVAIVMLMGVMKAVLGLNVGQILAFTMLSYLIMIVIEGVFIRLLLLGRRTPDAAGDAGLIKGQATNELDSAQARALPEPLPSVTEHTTRAFEPIYNERTSK